jgi:hypothetical protein
MDVEGSRQLLYSYVKNEGLRRHCIAVAAIMRALAPKMGGEPDAWEMIGILHDIDYELVNGDMQRHGEEGSRIIRSYGLDEKIAGAVRRHNDLLSGGQSEEAVDVALQASDNISGLVIAAAAVKGGRISEVSESTLRKKFKEKKFAAGCRREKIREISSLMELPEFFSLALFAIKERKEDLGLE